ASNSGREIAERRIHLWDMNDRRAPRVLPSNGSGGLVFSPDSTRLAYAEASYGLAVCDIPRGGVHKTQELGHPSATVLAFTPDGKTLASGGSDGTILLWNVLQLLKANKAP